jgi:hypothetical protein
MALLLKSLHEFAGDSSESIASSQESRSNTLALISQALLPHVQQLARGQQELLAESTPQSIQLLLEAVKNVAFSLNDAFSPQDHSAASSFPTFASSLLSPRSQSKAAQTAARAIHDLLAPLISKSSTTTSTSSSISSAPDTPSSAQLSAPTSETELLPNESLSADARAQLQQTLQVHLMAIARASITAAKELQSSALYDRFRI